MNRMDKIKSNGSKPAKIQSDSMASWSQPPKYPIDKKTSKKPLDLSNSPIEPTDLSSSPKPPFEPVSTVKERDS